MLRDPHFYSRSRLRKKRRSIKRSVQFYLFCQTVLYYYQPLFHFFVAQFWPFDKRSMWDNLQTAAIKCLFLRSLTPMQIWINTIADIFHCPSFNLRIHKRSFIHCVTCFSLLISWHYSLPTGTFISYLYFVIEAALELLLPPASCWSDVTSRGVGARLKKQNAGDYEWSGEIKLWIFCSKAPHWASLRLNDLSPFGSESLLSWKYI